MWLSSWIGCWTCKRANGDGYRWTLTKLQTLCIKSQKAPLMKIFDPRVMDSSHRFLSLQSPNNNASHATPLRESLSLIQCKYNKISCRLKNHKRNILLWIIHQNAWLYSHCSVRSSQVTEPSNHFCIQY